MEVALAALGIAATMGSALVWLLKKLYNQNDSTIKQNTAAVSKLVSTLSNLNRSIDAQVKAENEFRTKITELLLTIDGKIDTVQISIDKCKDTK